SLFLLLTAALRGTHSFPTRRSSDLLLAGRAYNVTTYVDPKDPAFQTMESAYEKKYGAAPQTNNSFVASSYDRVFLIKDAIETCGDRKSTRLNSSHLVISYAVIC